MRKTAVVLFLMFTVVACVGPAAKKAAEHEGGKEVQEEQAGGIWLVGGVDEQGAMDIPKLGGSDRQELKDARKFLNERREMRKLRTARPNILCSNVGWNCGAAARTSWM